MSDLVRMKAMRSWHNAEHEGTVHIGQEFNATAARAGDLERAQLAVRVTAAKPRVEIQTRAPRPLEFGDHGGVIQPSSSPPAQVQQAKTSRKPAAGRSFL